MAATPISTKSERAASRVDALRESIPSSWRAQHMPEHLRHTEGKFKNARGQSLSYVSLFPPADAAPVRGILFFLHGINEHCRRYYHLYEQLCESGFGVLAYDLLSHGQSDSCEHGVRAHARKFHYFVDDTNAMLAFAKESVFPQFLSKEQYPTLPPVVLSGMSYGTLVSLHTVLSEKHTFSAVVLVAPAVSVEMTTTLRVQRIFAKPLSALLPKARVVPAVNREWICRDPEFMEDFEKDPLNYGGEMTSRMGEQSLSAMIELQKDTRVEKADSNFCKAPILLMMGSNDKVTSLTAATDFFNRIANRDKEFKLFEGPYHALFDDTEKDQVFDHLIDWLHLRFPEFAVAAAPAKEEEAQPKEAIVETEAVPEPASADEVAVAEVKPEVAEVEKEATPEPVAVEEMKAEIAVEASAVKVEAVEAQAVTEAEKTEEVKVAATEVKAETVAVETVVEASAVKVEVVEAQVVTEQTSKTEEVKAVEEEAAAAVDVVQAEQKIEVEAAEVKTEVVPTAESPVAPTEQQPASAPQL